MDTITKDELFVKKDYFYNKIISKNEVFVHPTDTIYGLGCNAASEEAVKKLREIKNRTDRPLSIIAPSKKWILENCRITEKAKLWLNKLPGPYTLVLELKNKDAVAPNVTNGMSTIGVRIPFHWISEFTNFLDVPIITTSANITGNDYMTSLDELDSEIKKFTSFAIYEGPKKGNPSTIVKLNEEDEEIIKR